MNAKQFQVGIDDMVAYLPQIYLPISVLAEARDLEYAKLNKGLGLTAMSVADAHEDAATMAANAALRLIEQNQLQPQQIGRIYLGTESALDGAKPTATYVLDMLQRYFEPIYGKGCLRNCDVVDMTFACIGAVDAMHNTIDWVKGDANRIGIIIASDNAKYELGSGGEYTQGAGAVACLIKAAPRLLAISPQWGVATDPVHDFFKPKRKVSKLALISEVLELAGVKDVSAADVLSKLGDSIEVAGILDGNEKDLTLHKDTPVFDGPYSNDCYRERIGQALQHFAAQAGYTAKDVVSDNWRRLVFHLPYAYQARRMYAEIFLEEARLRGDDKELLKELGQEEPVAAHFEDKLSYQKAYAKFLRAVTKTERYRTFVAEKIERGERASSLVGNLYTASVFLALMSTLEADLQADKEVANEPIGFFSYGSGSKSKVFEGIIQEGWQDMVSRFNLMTSLEQRTAIDYPTYEALHRGTIKKSVAPVAGEFFLENVCMDAGVTQGARTYAWRERKHKEA